MLMDEPFGAVDPIVRDRLQNEFLRLQETIAKTILFVTHDIDEAIKMGDLVAVFQTGGILAQFGPPLDILAAPASAFVARFVGQDRGLKRLSLLRVSDVELAARPSPRRSATPRPTRGAARRVRPEATCSSSTTATGRSAGSRHGDLPTEGAITEAMANPVSPTVNRRTTLKDALSMMLDADVQTGIVVDRDGGRPGPPHHRGGRPKMREGEHAPAFDDLATLIAGDPERAGRRVEAGAADEAAIEQGV